MRIITFINVCLCFTRQFVLSNPHSFSRCQSWNVFWNVLLAAKVSIPTGEKDRFTVIRPLFCNKYQFKTLEKLFKQQWIMRKKWQCYFKRMEPSEFLMISGQLVILFYYSTNHINWINSDKETGNKIFWMDDFPAYNVPLASTQTSVRF